MRISRPFLISSALCALIVALAPGVAYAQNDPGATLSVPLYGQQTSVWCWDASSLMVIKFLRPSSTLAQCSLASQASAGQSCCTSPVPTPCVHTGWEMLTGNGFTSVANAPAISYDKLTTEIAAKRPVLYAIGWTGGGGHMLVADGWFLLNGVEYVSVNDPWPPTTGTKEQQTYDYWVGGSYYDHVTWNDWTNITDTQPKPTPRPSFVPFPFHTPLRILERVAQLPIGPDPVVKNIAIEPETTTLTRSAIEQLRSAPLSVIQRLGFTNASDVAAAQFGTPLREYVVGATTLAAYTRKTTPSSILTGGSTLFYPVISNDHFRSSLRVLARPGETAKVISLGDTATANALESVPAFGALVRAKSTTPIPAVRVPALGLYFVGQVVDGALRIAPTFDVPYLSLEKGRFEDAATVFARLAPFAGKVTQGTQTM